jgi:hypothetical protein
LQLQGSGRNATPCKEQLGILKNELSLYRSCTASLEPKVWKKLAGHEKPPQFFLQIARVKRCLAPFLQDR